MSTFAFQNNDASTNKVASVNLGVVENYAKVTDEPTLAVLSNKTCTLDQGELLSYRCNPVSQVTTSLRSQNPTRVTDGVQYVIKLEELLRTELGDKTVVDEPIVAYVTIRHQKSGNITGSIIDQVYQRLQGAILKSDGTTRFNDLMRSALVPTED